MLSFWEKQSFLTYDYIIVGAGIVGLSTAISLKEKFPHRSVLVLERGIFPTGASTKNAGFACFGSLTELISDIKILGKERTLALVTQRWQGLQLLRKRLGDQAIDFQCHGGYELLTEAQEPALAHLEDVNNLLHPLFGTDVFQLCNDKIKTFGFAQPPVKHLILNAFEGQIDTGKMMQHLWKRAAELGVLLLTGCTVEKFEGNSVLVSHQEQREIRFNAGQVAVCTNAFTSKFFPEEDIQPGRGIVLVTEPLERLPFQGVFHYDEGYYYFRHWENRVIFGGGRNIDFEAERTTDMAINRKIMEDLEEKLQAIILPHVHFKIAHSWAGIMAFGANKEPILKRINPHAVIGVRLGGMGVAIGSLLGQELADLLEEV